MAKKTTPKIKYMEPEKALKKISRQEDVVAYWREIVDTMEEINSKVCRTGGYEIRDLWVNEYKSNMNMLNQEEKVLEHMQWICGLIEIESSSSEEEEK